MKTQEMFDKVVTHLLTQKQKSLGPVPEGAYWEASIQSQFAINNTCLYRNPDGLKCAAGCLIPDDKYSLAMETLAVDGIPFFDSLCEDGLGQLLLLKFMQMIHDKDPVESWEDSLKLIASQKGLQFNWVSAS